ncbi:MAG: CBS domain-containing protein [Gammaproteobacteria bacterium]|nr:CBS domain-containing protein [Gammaproteobacteria bacterium]MCP4414651.1 CBS domain-containing protein [Gammaproteobacteria bacterium]
MLVNQIMSYQIQTVYADDTLALLSEIFEKVSYHHLPVIDENNILIGIISDRDVTMNLSPFTGTDLEEERDLNLLNQTAGDIMSVDPITVSQTSRIETASILLLEHDFSCLPVVDADGKIEGLFTWKDLLNYYIYAN